MDPEVLKSLIGAIKEVMLRAAGSKRQFSFFAWLLWAGVVRPTGELLYLSVALLATLWLLFIQFPSNDAQPKDDVPSAAGAAA